MKKFFLHSIRVAVLLYFVLPIGIFASTNTFATSSEYFYQRYSTHFDDFGLTYSVPGYGISDFKSPTTAREWMSLASYYKYRAIAGDESAKHMLHNALLKATGEINARPPKTQSFNDAEAYFLIIRMVESIPDLLTMDELATVHSSLSAHIEPGIRAADTENRALVAGAHWQYVAEYMYRTKLLDKTVKKKLDTLIKTKIDKAATSSITKSAWYKENKFTTFSLHYHAVSAFMLLAYGEQTHQSYYTRLAGRMYKNIKSVSAADGSIPQKNMGNRPVGLGAQFYLMAAVLGSYAGDTQYDRYVRYSQGDRFFSDPQHPNRLEYHSNDIHNPQFHDDYAYSDIAELTISIASPPYSLPHQ